MSDARFFSFEPTQVLNERVQGCWFEAKGQHDGLSHACDLTIRFHSRFDIRVACSVSTEESHADGPAGPFRSKVPEGHLTLVCRTMWKIPKFLGHFSEPAYSDIDISGASKSPVPRGDADLQHVIVMPPHSELEPSVHG
jgi:hypothetical protein